MEDRAQRKLSFAIVDEVDSILIDEARTPLIISGRSEDSTDLYLKINKLVPSLKLHSPPKGAVNDDIEASKVSLVGVSGEDLGEMRIDAAAAKAEEGGFHLVEIDAQAKPARCQLIVPGDYTVDEKAKQAHLTEEGHDRVDPGGSRLNRFQEQLRIFGRQTRAEIVDRRGVPKRFGVILPRETRGEAKRHVCIVLGHTNH